MPENVITKVKSNTNLILFYSLEQLISEFVNRKSLSLILIQKRNIVNRENNNKNLPGFCVATKKSTIIYMFYTFIMEKHRICISSFIKSGQGPHSPEAPFS
jgi:hypothetical protein